MLQVQCVLLVVFGLYGAEVSGTIFEAQKGSGLLVMLISRNAPIQCMVNSDHEFCKFDC